MVSPDLRWLDAGSTLGRLGGLSSPGVQKSWVMPIDTSMISPLLCYLLSSRFFPIFSVCKKPDAVESAADATEAEHRSRNSTPLGTCEEQNIYFL